MLESKFMQWFISLINLDMKYFTEEKGEKKKMYERIMKIRKK